MGMAMAGLGVAGGLVSAYGSMKAGQQQRAIDEYDANILDLQASQTIEQGDSDAGQTGVQGRRMIGAQRASYGAQGVNVNTGSAAELQLETGRLTEQQNKAILVNAARTAWGFQSQAVGKRFAGKMAEDAGNMQAIASVIGAGGSAAGMMGR